MGGKGERGRAGGKGSTGRGEGQGKLYNMGVLLPFLLIKPVGRTKQKTNNSNWSPSSYTLGLKIPFFSIGKFLHDLLSVQKRFSLKFVQILFISLGV